jgi:hypothetical protein
MLTTKHTSQKATNSQIMRENPFPNRSNKKRDVTQFFFFQLTKIQQPQAIVFFLDLLGPKSIVG